MKRLVTLLMAAAMIFSLAACGGNNEGNGVVSNLDFEVGDTGGLKVPFGNGEEIVMYAQDDVGDTSNTYIFDKLSQITGLNIKPILVPVSMAAEKVQVLLAGSDVPDVMNAGTLIQLNDYAMQGAWEPINDHLDEMPNFSRIFVDNKENDWIFKSFAAADKKLYAFPLIDSDRDVNHGMLYRKDIFDKHGIKMWNSPETFYQALKKLKEIYPNSYPLTSKTGKELITNYAVAWGGIKSYNVYYDESAKAWKYSDTDPKTKEILDYFKKLYDEKLLDPEFLTNTQPAWTQKVTTGTSFVTYDWIGRLDMFMSQNQVPGYDLRYANPVGPKQTILTLDKISPNGLVAVSKNKNSNLTMKLMDFLYSDAGAELMTCGVRGETFEIDENGMAKYLEFEEGKKVDIMDLRSKYCMWMTGTYRKVDKRSCYFQYTEREKEAQEWPAKCGGFEPSDPYVTFADEDDVSKVTDLTTKLSKKFEEVMFKYIIGQDSGDAAWNKWIAEAKKLGADELVKLYNDRHKELGL